MVMLIRELFEILRGFFSLIPPSSFLFPSHLPPSVIHQFFVDNILLNLHSQKYPPSIQYQKMFWKWAVQNLECLETDEDFEIDPRIYNHYLSLLPSSGLPTGQASPSVRDQICPQGLQLQGPPSQSYVTHYWKLPLDDSESGRSAATVDTADYETITLLESRTTIESGTTGLRTWLASFVLSHYLLSHPGLVADKRILELGSGIGFLGIIIASLQQKCSLDPRATALWMTDINEGVLTRCRDNAQMECNTSSSSMNLNYCTLDWSSALDPEMKAPLNTLLMEEINPDLILGADIIFDPTLVPALVAVITLALQPGWLPLQRRAAIIAVTVRNQTTLDLFLGLARRDLLVEEIKQDDGQIMFMEAVESQSQNNVKMFKISLI